MDEKTEELRDIFVETTGSETVTERQEAGRGSLAESGEVDGGTLDRVAELVATMRERYEFGTDLDDGALVELVRRYHEGADDDALAETLGVGPDTAFRARMDLHLVREADREVPVDREELRALVAAGRDDEAVADALDIDPGTVRRFRAILAAETEATRANDRFRDEFAELLTDADLSGRLASDAREDGLKEATEDIETNVSL